jgi:hypothetical protein
MNSLELNKEPEILPEEKTVESTAAAEQPAVENDVLAEKATETHQETVADEVKDEVQTPEQVQVQEVEKETVSVEEKKNYNTMNREELVEELKTLVHKDINLVKVDVELIKQAFYRKLNTEIDEQKKQFAENAENAGIEFKAAKDEVEENLKLLMSEFKAKKAAQAARIEQEKENNLLQKQHILEQMKTLTETKSDVSSHIGEFKNLQQKWKAIGSVPSVKTTELWKQYNLLQENFWDLIKINNELREYDFKKNYKLKLALCEAAERLLGEKDIIASARQMQKLHEEWREIGPVSREMREELWKRFKETTGTINKKYQAHFVGIRQNEEKNLKAKIALCEKLEGLDVSELKSHNAWDKAVGKIKKIQEEWRKLGFAPRKENQALFDRYRKACGNFFEKKTAFYKENKSEMTENLEKKKALCEQAEALKDSTDWKETTEKLIKIQRQWKEIGQVQRKHSDELLWKRFITACNYFFEQKLKITSKGRSEEAENLKAKQEIIEKIKNINVSNASKAHTELKELMEKYRKIGHVPFKEKDKIFKIYRQEVDKLLDGLNIDETNRRMNSFRNNLENMSARGEQKLYREREKLIRNYEQLKQQIATYENNIGFFTSSKKANSMLQEMERKIEGLKEEANIIEQKVKLIDSKI